jgi:menaquinone-dependent protoporphyrinogen IX oxidase
MGPMNVVVIYESMTGNTRREAELIGEAAAAKGATVALRPITAINLKELAEADVVFLGTWVDGFVFFGHRPGRAGRFWKMPVIDHKKTAVFMTYAVRAGKALDRFASLVEAKGGDLVGRALFRRDHLEDGTQEFVDSVLASVPAS